MNNNIDNGNNFGTYFVTLAFPMKIPIHKISVYISKKF